MLSVTVLSTVESALLRVPAGMDFGGELAGLRDQARDVVRNLSHLSDKINEDSIERARKRFSNWLLGYLFVAMQPRIDNVAANEIQNLPPETVNEFRTRMSEIAAFFEQVFDVSKLIENEDATEADLARARSELLKVKEQAIENYVAVFGDDV